MSKDLKTIDLNILPIETLKEMANDAAEQVENNAKLTVQKAADCGRYLTAIKEQCEPGTWLEWLGANWNYSRRTATRYMEIADHGTCMSHLKDASSINEALRMIADDKEEKTTPRSERKPANVVVSKPDETFEESQCAEAIATCGRGDERENEEQDDDPAPDPPTNRKTAKGSEKVAEDKTPRTQTVVPEILPDDEDEPDHVDDWFATRSLEDVCKKWLGPIADAKASKSAAKHLRKLADKLDPPTKFVKPDLDDVSAYMSTLGDAIGKDVATAADRFIDHYQSNGWMVGKVAMKDWQATARKWLKNQGQFTNGSNGNGKAQHNGRGRGLTADEVFS